MTERAAAPAALVAYLEATGVQHNIVVPGVPMPTVQAAAKAISTEPAAIVKSLVWQAADGTLALVIASGAAKVDRKKLAAATGKTGWQLAPPDVVAAATGYAPGGVPPIGPGYGTRISVLIDRAVMTQPVVFGGGGDAAVLLCLIPRDIARLTGAEIHDLVA